MKRFLFALVASVVLPLAAIAADTIKIGGLFSITGPASFIGEPERNSMEMAIEEINQAGGIHGKKLVSVMYDTGGDARKTVNFFRRLTKNDGVNIIVGPSLSGSTLAIKDMIEKEPDVTVLSCAASDKIVNPIVKNLFKTAQSDDIAVERIFGYLQKLDVKRIAIMTATNGFGQSGDEQLTRLAADYGLQIVINEKFGPADTDMTGQLTKIRRAEPEFLIVWSINPGPAIIAKNMKQLGIDIPTINSHGVASRRFIELAGADAEGIILPSGRITIVDQIPDNHPQKEILVRYNQAYRTKFNAEPSHFGAHAYDAVYLIKAALEQNGNIAELATTLESLPPQTLVDGVFTYSATDHSGLSADAFSLLRVKNGQWEIIED